MGERRINPLFNVHDVYTRMKIINPYRFSVGVDTLKDSLVSCWEFNETSGTTAFDAHGSNDGTNTNITVNQTGTTNITPCYDFNGSSSYVTVSHAAALNPDLGDFSVNIWAKYEGADLSTDIDTLISKGVYTSDGDEWSLVLRGANNGFYFRTRVNGGPLEQMSPTVDQTSNIDDGGWHMFTAVVDEGGSPEGTIYLDGGSVGTIATFTNDIDNTASLYIGRIGSSFYFNGKIDQPAIWSKALSTDEISALYNSGSGLAYSNW